jgi:hypothetical protein
MYRLSTRILESLIYMKSNYKDVLRASNYDTNFNPVIRDIFEATRDILSGIVIITEVAWIRVCTLAVLAILLREDTLYLW